MRIFYAFLIIMVAAVLFMIPVDQGIYDFRTMLRTDTFNYETGAAETTANVTLSNILYDDDTDTIDILSSISDDVPLFSSYNSTVRLLDMTDLAVSENRTLTVTYDIDSLGGSDAVNTLLDRFPFIWMLCVIAFPMVALFAIFTGRV